MSTSGARLKKDHGLEPWSFFVIIKKPNITVESIKIAKKRRIYCSSIELNNKEVCKNIKKQK